MMDSVSRLASRSNDYQTRTLGIRERIDDIADRHWRFKNLTPKTLVPMLEAAHCFRDHRRRDKGIDAEVLALTWFWDKLAETLLNGVFDGQAAMYVLDDRPIFATLGCDRSEFGYRLTSDHMKLLTSETYTYEDVLKRCFARSWCPLKIAFDWCEQHGLPIPARWQTTEQAEPSDAYRRGDMRPQASKAAIRQAMIRRVEEWPSDKPHPSQEDDLAFLKATLGKEVNREQYRNIRQSVAPAWNRRGRPTKAKSARI